MMREIKFRAWHPKLEQMFYDCRVSSGDWVDNSTHFGGEHDMLMQYTGLKDKNGVEIYEGDIVKECTVGSVIWDGDGVIEEGPTGIVEITPYCTNLQRLKKGRVKVKEGSIVDHYQTGYSELNITTYDGVYQWPEDIEVIGNIHENPELLEKI